MKVRVLVLDGHTNQALACVRSLARAGHTVLVASHRRGALGAWSRFCQGRIRIAGETIEAYGELRAWARLQGVQVVLPITERACLLCNAERPEWQAAGMVLGCATSDVLVRAFDKARTLRQAADCGVRVPATRLPQSLAECHAAAAEVGFPCIVKSRFSNAWDGEAFRPEIGTSYVAGPGDVAGAVAVHRKGKHWPLIQGFVPGRGKGVFALCEAGRPLAWFAHERLRDVRPSGSGSSLRRSITLDARLRDPVERLLSEMRWHGPAMVEFRDDGAAAPCLMEVNGRFWGSLQLAISAGVDFPALWLAMLTGRPVHLPATYQEGIVLRWLWGDVKRLLYILAGPPPGYPESFPRRAQGFRELFAPQPSGTRVETWDADDYWPAVGEWVQGIGELAARVRFGRRAAAVTWESSDGAQQALHGR